jgi:hypothetical protein
VEGRPGRGGDRREAGWGERMGRGLVKNVWETRWHPGRRPGEGGEAIGEGILRRLDGGCSSSSDLGVGVFAPLRTSFSGAALGSKGPVCGVEDGGRSTSRSSPLPDGWPREGCIMSSLGASTSSHTVTVTSTRVCSDPTHTTPNAPGPLFVGNGKRLTVGVFLAGHFQRGKRPGDRGPWMGSRLYPGPRCALADGGDGREIGTNYSSEGLGNIGAYLR